MLLRCPVPSLVPSRDLALLDPQDSKGLHNHRPRALQREQAPPWRRPLLQKQRQLPPRSPQLLPRSLLPPPPCLLPPPRSLLPPSQKRLPMTLRWHPFRSCQASRENAKSGWAGMRNVGACSVWKRVWRRAHERAAQTGCMTTWEIALPHLYPHASEDAHARSAHNLLTTRPQASSGPAACSSAFTTPASVLATLIQPAQMQLAPAGSPSRDPS